ncbi:MAG: protein-L-isoaspartate(D-aspartate) O-methyltransferase [Actinomycetia bacterium]|nr:protein-L-isoaspartate(D-aspartate) O-methyltransferase [Actinomycetes bacterium]
MSRPRIHRSEDPRQDPYAHAREDLIDHDLVERGIIDERVLQAMATVRREGFVGEELADVAYADRPLPIGSGQTISQPFIVAAMAEAAELEPTDRVLEIGTGSGYGAAVLASLAGEVFTIERVEALADSARDRLRQQGFERVQVRVGDGTLGWPEEAPFNAIVVTAGGPEVPPALRQQLAEGGRLIMPVGHDPRLQSLVRVRRSGDGATIEDLGAVRFVPLIGAQAWGPGPGTASDDTDADADADADADD